MALQLSIEEGQGEGVGGLCYHWYNTNGIHMYNLHLVPIALVEIPEQV